MSIVIAIMGWGWDQVKVITGVVMVGVYVDTAGDDFDLGTAGTGECSVGYRGLLEICGGGGGVAGELIGTVGGAIGLGGGGVGGDGVAGGVLGGVSGVGGGAADEFIGIVGGAIGLGGVSG